MKEQLECLKMEGVKYFPMMKVMLMITSLLVPLLEGNYLEKLIKEH